jgi:hypothetical protein
VTYIEALAVDGATISPVDGLSKHHSHQRNRWRNIRSDYKALQMSCNRQPGRILRVVMFTANGLSAPGDVRSADQEGRSMMGTVVFRGVPNQPESASRSASAAVSAGFVDGCGPGDVGVRADQEGVGWSVIGFGGVDVDAMLPVSGGLAEIRSCRIDQQRCEALHPPEGYDVVNLDATLGQ